MSTVLIVVIVIVVLVLAAVVARRAMERRRVEKERLAEQAVSHRDEAQSRAAKASSFEEEEQAKRAEAAEAADVAERHARLAEEHRDRADQLVDESEGAGAQSERERERARRHGQKANEIEEELTRRRDLPGATRRAAASLRLRNRGDGLGRDERAVRGRDPRPQRADLPGRGPPLRAGPARRPRPRQQLRVRGHARRRAGLARARGHAAERDPHARGPRPARDRLRLLPGRPPPRAALHRRAPTRRTGFELDALWVLAKQMVENERFRRPDQLFLLGDQVYVDEGSPKTREPRSGSGAAPTRRPARRSSTSRSTPGSTARAGGSR